jgi:hypothetical protein
MDRFWDDAEEMSMSIGMLTDIDDVDVDEEVIFSIFLSSLF